MGIANGKVFKRFFSHKKSFNSSIAIIQNLDGSKEKGSYEEPRA
jgi:hypothetical protein